MTQLSRREILQRGLRSSGVMAGIAMLPRPLLVTLGAFPEPVPPIQDTRLQQLIQRGLDAARAAGATYADVRLTYTKDLEIRDRPVNGLEQLHVGVRALFQGCWGFASSTVWQPDEMARLGKEAVRQAKAGSDGDIREVNLADAPVVTGHWEMPVAFDVDHIDRNMIADINAGLISWMSSGFGWKLRNDKVNRVDVRVRFLVQNKAFGSTTGSLCTQRRHLVKGNVAWNTDRKLVGDLEELSWAGMGWELMRDTPLRDLVWQRVEELQEEHALPFKPVDVGRYDIVLDAGMTASALSKSIGVATELDRALGFEANAGGTSYLIDPVEMLGTYHLGSPLLTVTANHSESGGAATAKWDDEGVAGEPFTLIDRGIVRDFHTSREGAEWLRDAYQREQRPIQSRGCVVAYTASEAPLVRPANLMMTPSTDSVTYKDIEVSLDKGISFARGYLGVDFQCTSGELMGTAFEIRGGKRVARIGNAGALFRTSELWKNILRVGGAPSARRFGIELRKGNPQQWWVHSVTAVPMAVKEMTVIEVGRR